MAINIAYFSLQDFAFPVVSASPVIPDADDYSPADILRWLMISMGIGSTPTDNDVWPIYWDREPGKESDPDNVITTYDTSPKSDGRSMETGQMFQHFGVQIRVRGKTAAISYKKAKTIETELSQSVRNESITLNSITYTIYALSNLSVVRMGKDMPNSMRSIYTINGLISLRRDD